MTMLHWGQDVLLTRRGLIVCAAGLVVAKAARADLTPTPAQTAGPYYPNVRPRDVDMDLTRIRGAGGQAAGQVIDVSGRVFSVKGHALSEAVVEIWQADTNGRYIDVKDRSVSAPRDRRFQGYGAVRVGAGGAYRFRTIRPASYDTGFSKRTPHIHFRVEHQKLGELVTQMYFPGETMNKQDVVYLALSGNLARDAATARLRPGNGPPRYTFDLVLD